MRRYDDVIKDRKVSETCSTQNKEKSVCKFWSENLNENLKVDGRSVRFKETFLGLKVNSSGAEWLPVTSSCKYGNKHSVLHIAGDFLVNWPRDGLLTTHFQHEQQQIIYLYFRPVSFRALYEFVDLHQDGEQYGTGPCSRKFVSRSQGPLPDGPQNFQAPKNVFLYGRGGSQNMR